MVQIERSTEREEFPELGSHGETTLVKFRLKLAVELQVLTWREARVIP